MKVLFISPFDIVTERLWGPSARIFSLAKEFKAKGHDVWFAGGNEFRGKEAKELDGIPLLYLPTCPFHRYPYDEERLTAIKKARENLFRATVMLAWVALRRLLSLRRICRKKKIDVIYVGRTFPETIVPAYLVKKLTGIPLVVDWDDIEGLFGFSSHLRQKLRLQVVYSFFETEFATLADAVVAASRFLYDTSLDIGVKPDRLFHAPTVGDHKKFRPNGLPVTKNRKSPTLFYAGNLRAENGVKVENIIYTLAEVKKVCPEAKLLVAGGGDLLDDGEKPGLLRRLAEELGLQDSIEFTGDVPHSQMPQELGRADICLALFPINVITLAKSPIKVYEYMCAGKPVVARAVGEINGCITDGENGYLVYTDNPKEYAAKIISALSDTARLAEVGQKARQTVEERFNWSISADTALKACQRAIAKK